MVDVQTGTDSILAVILMKVFNASSRSGLSDPSLFVNLVSLYPMVSNVVF